MKKFKLIKAYPNSPDLGVVVEEDKIGQFVSNTIEIFDKYTIENFPEFWEVIKDPILTTEDGVDIYEGDSYWYIPKGTTEIVEIDSSIIGEDFAGGDLDFSTEELAREHVLMNTACLSIEDVIKTVDYINKGGRAEENLKDLVTNRI